ncbi:MAG: pyridoxamine 5'-phosphate oxidase family protein [Actinomycetota bacterium]
MFETPGEVARLQSLLDESYSAAGSHLASIHVPRARLTARELAARLTGMNVFVVATVTSDGRPRTGPVDAFLFHGELRFGTAANAVRARHLARSPAVSATHAQGEGLVVTVHGNAERLELDGPDAEFQTFLRRHYGAELYDQELNGSPYYRVLAERMFAADMTRLGAPQD